MENVKETSEGLLIKRKLNRINTEIGKDGRSIQLCKEKDQLEDAFYRSLK